MSFYITFHHRVEKGLRSIPSGIAQRILLLIQQLENDPFPEGKKTKKLRGRTGEYRLRVGNYRVIYSLDCETKTILVQSIFYGHTGY